MNNTKYILDENGQSMGEYLIIVIVMVLAIVSTIALIASGGPC